jgi:hypothetical protein
VRRAWGFHAAKIRNALLGVGRALAPLLSHRGPQEIQAIIDRPIIGILKELADDEFRPL